MRSPNTGNPMREVENEATPHNLRGETFLVGSPAWECPDTGERYFTPEQGNVFLARMHRAWRERHGIGKEALRERRKALGLSAAQASALLGFGINQYRTYENTDKLPSKSNAVLLKLLLEEEALPSLMRAAGAALTSTALRNLQARLTIPITHPINSASPGTWLQKPMLKPTGLRSLATTRPKPNEQLLKPAQSSRLLDVHTTHGHSHHAYS